MVKKPKYLILENVRDLVSKRFFPLFSKWMEELDRMGYDNHWQVVNASDCNCPQNRQRVILVSIRRFEFPKSQDLTNTLETMMDKEIDPNSMYLQTRLDVSWSHNHSRTLSWSDRQPRKDILR